MEKKAGVLLPISSLPGKYGVGDFGAEAIKAIDIFKESGFKLLQVLPLNPLGYGNSPYQSYSSYAIDPIYIDLEDLLDRALITELPQVLEQSDKVDYERARSIKMEALEIAVGRFVEDESYHNFISENEWVAEYSKYMAIKEQDNSKIWYEWDRAYIKYSSDIVVDNDRVRFYQIIQYLLFSQWNKIRNYANQCGIKIIGDIPIYVSIDSHDVWCHPENYLLDSDGRPTHVAGVPPDYFSEDGQLWGNPLYDWECLEKNNFQFWIDRLSHNKKMYDIIRIDHFRAFDTFWKIPYGDMTARNGEWIVAPGHKVFEEISKYFTEEEIVVEDLGQMRPEVFQLRDDFNLMGMKIIQFSLDPEETNNNFEDYPNLLVYTGTHDNQTLQGWVDSQTDKAKDNLKQQFGEDLVAGIVKNMFGSVANYAIIPVQDIIKLGDRARFNTPGTVNDINWTWKLTTLENLDKEKEYFKNMIRLTGR